MGQMRYLAERVAITNKQLASWQVQRTRTELTLRGACPACGDETSANLARTAATLETADGKEASARLTAAIECACQRPHQDRPADASSPGCGRTWPVTAFFGPNESTTLRPAAEPDRVEAAEAFRSAQASQLTAIRLAAEKWTAGVAALIGVTGLVLPLAGRDAIRTMLPWAQLLLGATLAAALGAAAAAVLLANRAAYGLPTVRVVDDDDALLDWYATHRARPATAAHQLRRAIQAALATAGALAIAAGLATFGPARPASTSPVQITRPNGAIICGVLLASTADSRLKIRRTDSGDVALLPVGEVTRLKPVKAC